MSSFGAAGQGGGWGGGGQQQLRQQQQQQQQQVMRAMVACLNANFILDAADTLWFSHCDEVRVTLKPAPPQAPPKPKACWRKPRRVFSFPRRLLWDRPRRRSRPVGPCSGGGSPTQRCRTPSAATQVKNQGGGVIDIQRCPSPLYIVVARGRSNLFLRSYFSSHCPLTVSPSSPPSSPLSLCR